MTALPCVVDLRNAFSRQQTVNTASDTLLAGRIIVLDRCRCSRRDAGDAVRSRASNVDVVFVVLSNFFKLRFRRGDLRSNGVPLARTIIVRQSQK